MTNNKQQTAVDYYSKEIGRLTSDLITGKITGKQFVMLEIQLLEQAKEMEKKQIIEAFDFGDYCVDLPEGGWRQKYDSPEQYYNETYGGCEQ